MSKLVEAVEHYLEVKAREGSINSMAQFEAEVDMAEALEEHKSRPRVGRKIVNLLQEIGKLGGDVTFRTDYLGSMEVEMSLSYRGEGDRFVLSYELSEEHREKSLINQLENFKMYLGNKR